MQNNVYVSLKGYSQGNGKDILGIYTDHGSAVNRCLHERTLTRDSWKPTRGWVDRWDNGVGLYVMVAEYPVE
jgi:hypothetical protein